MDLAVYCDETEICTSNLAKSAAEVAYFPLRDSGNYKIEIKRYTKIYNGTVRYGYAYSTDKPYDSSITQEGIYYLKSYNGNYLTLNTSNNSLQFQTFKGDTTQQWIIKEEDKYGVGIYPGYESISGGIGSGTSIASGVSATAIKDTIYPFTLFGFEDTGRQDGAVYFYSTRSGGIFRGTTLMMHAGNAEPATNELWYLEKVGYQLGDVNMDGILSTDDATAIQKYLLGMQEFNNIQTYLADVDNDGIISIRDAIEVQRKLQ